MKEKLKKDNRGGARKGAGRKKCDRHTTLTIMISERAAKILKEMKLKSKSEFFDKLITTKFGKL